MNTIAVFEINTSLKIAIHDIDVDSMKKKENIIRLFFHQYRLKVEIMTHYSK